MTDGIEKIPDDFDIKNLSEKEKVLLLEALKAMRKKPDSIVDMLSFRERHIDESA